MYNTRILHGASESRICLLKPEEQNLRLGRLKACMAERRLDAAIITDYANLYYLTGRVFTGYVYVSTSLDQPVYFLRRPDNLQGDNCIKIHKIEEVPALLVDFGGIPETLGAEKDSLSYNEICRISKAFGGKDLGDVSPAIRDARAVKTADQIQMLRESGDHHVRIYRELPRYYQPGMTDIELQIEIERALRLEGGLGQFRIGGRSMEIFMGCVLTGDNADNECPYDFALGGAGLDPSIPVGASGSMIMPGSTVLVDLGGNFNGYMTDMSRTFTLGHVPEIAVKTHRMSLDIHDAIVDKAVPGTQTSDLYNLAMDMVKKAGLENYFMGHHYHAGFIGHGVGIEINELPVIAPRSRDILQPGNVIALEPKFVIPGVGATGIENTYYMSDDGHLENLTPAPRELRSLSE